ncbi:Abi family protein [Parerythrobacter lacustris]|uniref:Abi family protein n=1 Tax=Parerythrobacter lacustris TaxID=2969984 RepID=A0ABT1XR98_9SPHN|nr:Abi family protein [Parerythrobacter lacustris]MCR2834132.1 Abi family protein [Parerythrobacter lacustris]
MIYQGGSMLFSKPATTIEQQLEFLKDRGMGGDVELQRRWLETVGYYRLSAYWLPFETAPAVGQTRTKRFRDGVEFEQIVDIYVFDRKLRLLVMEAIERIEIALRSRWTNRLSLASGAHAYLDADVFSGGFDHPLRVSQLSGRVKSSREVFVEHYQKRYRRPFLPPLWIVSELMTLGELSRWIADTEDRSLQSDLAKDIGLPSSTTLIGTLHLLSYVRNICAHHGRLWNRKTAKRLPLIKRFQSDLVVTETVTKGGIQRQPDNYIYNVLVALTRLIRHQSPDSSYPDRVVELMRKRSNADLSAMGFPEDWLERPCWVLKAN